MNTVSLSVIELLVVWAQSHAVECVIITFFLLFSLWNYRAYRKLQQVLSEQYLSADERRRQQYDDNEALKIELRSVSEALVIRSEHLSEMIREQYRQYRQDGDSHNAMLSSSMTQLREYLHSHQEQSQKSTHQQFYALQRVIAEQLNHQTEQVRHNVESLNKTTESRLNAIATQVNQQLEQGFHKTNNTFTDIQKRLSVIDEAQKRIDHLSSNVVSLQNVLTDKRARGAFGEVQLQTIVENALPAQFVDFQYTLSNGKRADCIIHLPDPSGDMVIDAKFPLETYRQLTADNNSEQQRISISQQFKKDIKKHITDIASKYIVPPETAESAILFIPAEAIFSEIHAHHGDVVEFAQRQQVWLASPTTLMAILATAQSVIKDEATRKQAHIMREQLQRLKTDFDRFQARMDSLAKRIEQAGKEATDVSVSATKISKHFQRIEAVDTWMETGAPTDGSEL